MVSTNFQGERRDHAPQVPGQCPFDRTKLPASEVEARLIVGAVRVVHNELDVVGCVSAPDVLAVPSRGGGRGVGRGVGRTVGGLGGTAFELLHTGLVSHNVCINA